MAELEGSAAIVPQAVDLTRASSASVPVASPRAGYSLAVTEFDAAGKSSTLSVPVPDGSLEFRQWSILARAALLKTTTWSKFSMPQIIMGIMFADKVGLDVELGDVYSTDGRPAISAEGRIKLAQKDPRYRGSKSTFRDTGEPLNKPKCILKTDLECTVEVYVDGWQEPIRRTARLSRWHKDTPAWNERPEHQLELNTLGHACRFLRPVGDPADTGEEVQVVGGTR
jgi:hypothetical protein